MTNDKTALDFFTRLSYGYVSDYAVRERYGYGLHLQGSALGRFGQIAGWLTGLAHAGKADLAAKLAEDFDASLKGALAGCACEDMEVRRDGFSSDEGEGTVRAPRMKLVLTDDGTFGGFGLAWYRAISNFDRLKLARSLDEEAYSSCDLPAGESERRWATALEKAGDKLRLRKDIEEMRYYTPSWANAETPSYIRTTGAIIHYGFVYNGGLLYHGPGGGEVFAVTLGDVRGWSVHT
jgi:hypothetical protein